MRAQSQQPSNSNTKYGSMTGGGKQSSNNPYQNKQSTKRSIGGESQTDRNEEEIDLEEYQLKLEKLGSKLDYKEFVKTHPLSDLVHEDLAQDWFTFENKLRQLNYDLIKPLTLIQKKQRAKIGQMMVKIDNLNLQQHSLDGDIGKCRFDLRQIEKVMLEITELGNRVRSIEENCDSKFGEYNKKCMTLTEKTRINDSSNRALDNDIKVLKNELKAMNKLVVDTRDAQSGIFARGLSEFESRHSQLMQQINLSNERIAQSNSQLDRTKEHISAYDRKIAQIRVEMRADAKNEIDQIRQELENDLHMKMEEMNEATVTQNRFLSDLRVSQNEVENYIEKYLPYNTMVDVIKMLNQTVTDSQFFNQLVSYQSFLKDNFVSEHLDKLVDRMYSLDKRRISTLDVPRKRRVEVPEHIGDKKKKKRAGAALDMEEQTESQLKLDRAVKAQIRERLRRNSAQGKRKEQGFTFIREIKVRSKDDLRFEGLGRQMEFKCEFKQESQIDQNMIEELMKNANLDHSALMQEPQTTMQQEKPTLNHKKVFKHQGTPPSLHSSALQRASNQLGNNGYESPFNQLQQSSSHNPLTARTVQIIHSEYQQQQQQQPQQPTPQMFSLPDPQLKIQVQTLEKAVTELKRLLEYVKKDIKDSNEDLTKIQRDQYGAFQGQLKNIEGLVKTELIKAQLKIKEDFAKSMTQMPPTTQSSGQSQPSQSKATSSSSSNIDESEIKKLINANISRMQLYMQSQVDTMKNSMDKGLTELGQILPKVTNYDKELRLMQASVRQINKDVKSQGDKLGELIFNLTESTNSHQINQSNLLESLRTETKDKFENNEIKLDDRFLEFTKKCQLIARDEIRDAFPDQFLRVAEMVREQTGQLKDHILSIVESQRVALDSKIQDLDAQISDLSAFMKQDSANLRQERQNMQQSLEKQIKDLFEFVEVRYLKKQKNKADFMLEVKTMENKMKTFSENIKECLALNENLTVLHNLVKIIECDVLINSLSTKHHTMLQLSKSTETNSPLFRWYQNSMFSDVKTSRLKESVKDMLRRKMDSKSSDLDVELDYLVEQARKIAIDLEQEVKIPETQMQKPVFEAVKPKMSKLEQLLAQSNKHLPQFGIGSKQHPQQQNPNDWNPYNLMGNDQNHNSHSGQDSGGGVTATVFMNPMQAINNTNSQKLINNNSRNASISNVPGGAMPVIVGGRNQQLQPQYLMNKSSVQQQVQLFKQQNQLEQQNSEQVRNNYSQLTTSTAKPNRRIISLSPNQERTILKSVVKL